MQPRPNIMPMNAKGGRGYPRGSGGPSHPVLGNPMASRPSPGPMRNNRMEAQGPPSPYSNPQATMQSASFGRGGRGQAPGPATFGLPARSIIPAFNTPRGPVPVPLGTSGREFVKGYAQKGKGMGKGMGRGVGRY